MPQRANNRRYKTAKLVKRETLKGINRGLTFLKLAKHWTKLLSKDKKQVVWGFGFVVLYVDNIYKNITMHFYSLKTADLN